MGKTVSENKQMSQEQLHNDLLDLKEEVKRQGNIQSDMRDAILILTETSKQLSSVQQKQEEHSRINQNQEVRISLLEQSLTTLNSTVNLFTNELKPLNTASTQNTMITKAAVTVTLLVVSGVGGLVFKILYDIASKTI